MPSFTIDNDSDFNPAPTQVDSFHARTLLLAPPSISSHEEKLREILSQHDRAVTDLQMLDRLSAGFVALPAATYDLVLILSDADGTRVQSNQLLGREEYYKIFEALKAGGRLQSQDATFGLDLSSPVYTEAILAGLVPKGAEGMVKPDYSASEAVPLRFGKKKDKNTDAVPINLKRKSVDITSNKPVGVGFVDFSDDFDEPMITGEDDDDELIDEDTLLTADDLKRDIVIPAECIPKVGKRRRACKDCTCGLAEKIATEETERRAKADTQLKSFMLNSEDLTAEVDFTVQGKVGSCGNCSLGDAFRCAGCPFTGMPRFSTTEEGVRLLNNDVQL